MSDGFGNGDELELPMGEAACEAGEYEVNRLIKENSHLFTDTSCKVCSAVLISESQKLAHYQSKKHANKYRRYLSIQQGEEFIPAKKMKPDNVPVVDADVDRNKYCPICNMFFSSAVVAMSHYEGKPHSKNLKLKQQGGALEGGPPASKKSAPRVQPSSAPKTPGSADQSDPDQFCSLCKATFNNPHMAEQHYMGKKHKKHETKSKLMTIYTSSGNTLPQTTPLKPLRPGTGSTGNGFSCATCNIIVNSIEQYQAHITGAKHKTNLMAMITTSSGRLSPSPDRKSFGGVSSSSRRFTPEAPYAGSNFSSSPGGLSSSNYYSSSGGFSSAGSLSSSYGLSSAGRFSSGGGLLPRPSYASQIHQSYVNKETIGPDGYNYFNQGY
ncbi:zinc finger protein 346 isoform X2 [Pseudophryne corroboree]|uniref:zinc finger protein 346 isoform X2 n=1 Tax=Pseudophryne corroboree TaxID=495146 RepID=UPI0030819AF2